jgi:hypothetical protein
MPRISEDGVVIVVLNFPPNLVSQFSNSNSNLKFAAYLPRRNSLDLNWVSQILHRRSPYEELRWERIE